MRPDEIRALEELERIWLGNYGPVVHRGTVKERVYRDDEPVPRTDLGPPERGDPAPDFLMVDYEQHEEYGLPPPRTFWRRFFDDVPATIVVACVTSLATAGVILAVMLRH